MLIGWLGRDLGFRGQDTGGLLLRDAMTRVSGSAIGAYAVFADAIDEAAMAFYGKYQFTPLASRPGTLFLPLTAGVRRDRDVLGIEGFTDTEIEAIRRAEPSPEADAFNRELKL